MLKIPSCNRLLLNVTLNPVPSLRFQPTGFPDIGAATYDAPDGRRMLLVESAQSMANRLESVCYDGELHPALKGLPFVKVQTKKGASSTFEEAHRLNSVYIVKTKTFFADFAKKLDFKPKGKKFEATRTVSRRELAQVIMSVDPNSVVHGVFLEKLAGTLRLPRLLTAFIEASDVREVVSGGVKNDRLDASGKDAGGSAEGFGNVPYHRTEYTAKDITAFFSLDLHLLRSYKLGPELERVLYTLCLWKVRRLLDGDLRLRTACDFEVLDLHARRPEGWRLPSANELDDEMASALHDAHDLLGPVVQAESQV